MILYNELYELFKLGINLLEYARETFIRDTLWLLHKIQ